MKRSRRWRKTCRKAAEAQKGGRRRRKRSRTREITTRIRMADPTTMTARLEAAANEGDAASIRSEHDVMMRDYEAE